MTKQLKVFVTHIKCVNPQDPVADELYFITGAKDTSHTTDTIRHIRQGYDEKVKIELLKADMDEHTILPIQITLWEQRALRDNGKVAKALEEIANRATAYAKDNLGGLGWPTVAAKIATLILENAVSFFKHIFEDSPLGTKEIVVPRVAVPNEKLQYPKKIEGTETHKIEIKGKKESYYHYIIDVEVTIH
jgi:hypothetical protein